MTDGDRAPVRVALLPGDRNGGREAQELAAALRDAGQEPQLLEAATLDVAEGLLRRRGFAGPLTSMPFDLAALVRGDFDLAHAFGPPSAVTALAWRRLVGRPVVFTCVESLDRSRLSDRRLRLWMLERATRGTDAVTAATQESRAGLARWLALDAPVIRPGDAAGYGRLYRELLARGR